MPERCVPEVVTKSDGLGELLMQLQHLRDGARDLRDLERVCQTRAVMIARGREEHLGLMLEPAKRLGMHDAVAVSLERRPHIVFGFFARAPARVRALRGLRRKNLPLASLEVFTDAGHYRLRSIAGLTDWQIEPAIIKHDSLIFFNLPILPIYQSINADHLRNSFHVPLDQHGNYRR